MRHRINRRSNFRDTIGVIAFVLLFCVAAGWWPDRLTNGRALGSPPNVPASTSPFEISGPPASPDDIASAEHSARIYGHSLVPGGIHSVDELATLMRNDPVLSEHYRGFDLSRTRFIVVDHDVAAYVSYRLGDKIYWEAEPTVINKGELVLTDGTNFIRARCGNRISYIPVFPTTPQEPTDMDLISKITSPDPIFPAPAAPSLTSLNQPLLSFPYTGPSAPLAGAANPGGSPPYGGAPCCFGGVNPPIPLSGAGPSNPPTQFSADEFSTLHLTILRHIANVPSELASLAAGILLVLVIQFIFRG